MKCPCCRKADLKRYTDQDIDMPSFKHAIANYCHEGQCNKQIVCDSCYENCMSKLYGFRKLHDREEHNSVDLS